MADEFDKSELESKILELGKLVIFKYRDQKLTGKQQRTYNAFGWYADSIGEALWESNQLLTVILDEMSSQNRALLEKTEQAMAEIEDYKHTVEVLTENVRNLNDDRQSLIVRAESAERRLEEMDKWIKSCIDEHNARFDSHDIRLDENNARFDEHDRRLDENNKRFDEHDRRLDENNKRFDGYDNRLDENNARFDEHDRRLDENNARFDEHDRRLDENNKRFDDHDKHFNNADIRLNDIETREIWVRNRFNECFDRLYRLDTIVNDSISKNEISVNYEEEDGYILNKVILNNREFFLATSLDDRYSISEAARTGRIICTNTDLLHIFGDTGVFVDIGANIGVFSLSLAAQGWRGIAIEAGEKNFGVLSKAIAKNGFDITAINKAVSDHTGTIRFFENGPEGYVGNNIIDEKCLVEIPATTLDDELKEIKKKYDSINLIKMDIEGSEVAAIRGMKIFLKEYNYPPVFAESNVYTLSLQNESPITMGTEMEKLGYCTCVFKNDKLYLYDYRNFQTECCTDRMYIHRSDIERMNVLPEEEYDEQNIRVLIDEKLDTYISDLKSGVLNKNSENEERSYIFYLLQFYPQYCSKEVKEKLRYIFNVQKGNVYIFKILSWIEK
ncbi:MAG: FkbM family methyltransferase [Oscillospiraceae bacterium]|nr:FkbM family methyltransferase [Oscillospiraceae bacterium]